MVSENKYNDYQILTPIEMEKIAKQYNKYFKEIENKNSTNYAREQISIALFNVYKKIESLHNFCSDKFYNLKKTEITNILADIKKVVSLPETTSCDAINISNNNYCKLIKSCITDLCTGINYSAKLILINSTYLNIHNKLTELLKQICALLVECKYRNC